MREWLCDTVYSKTTPPPKTKKKKVYREKKWKYICIYKQRTISFEFMFKLAHMLTNKEEKWINKRKTSEVDGPFCVGKVECFNLL